jgi:dTDP-4-dehydrorhamnose reductase
MREKSQEITMDQKINVAATGLDGLVGTRVKSILSKSCNFVSLPENELDITNREQTLTAINNIEFDVFLHLAAFTNVDAAESNQEVAWKVNVDGTQNVYDAVTAKGKKIIYVSTGFVFDGENPPYYEDSPVNPLSYYGKTKLEGEKIIGNTGVTIRIDYPYGSHVEYKKDLVESLIDILKEKKPLQGISDQIMTPTYIDDIAHSLNYLIHNFKPNIYHIVGADSLSGIEIIHTIGKVFDLDTSYVTETTYDEFYKGKASRPKNSVMKSKNNNFYQARTFQQSLENLKSRIYLG